MKKLMIAILLLVPLVIVASVYLASEIISLTAYVAVDSVTLNRQSVSSADGFTLESPVYDGLQVEIYPALATNKNIIWTIEEVTRFDDYEGALATVDEKGIVTGLGYGVYYVVATSAEGVKSARCLFSLTSSEVTSIEIASQCSLERGDSTILNAIYRPIDSIVTAAEWSSSVPAVATVDANGIVKAVSEGTTIVTCRTGNAYAECRVTITSGASRYGTDFALSGTTYNLDTLGLSGATAVSGATISGGVLTIVGTEAVLTTAGGRTVTIEKCAANDVVIDQASKMSTAAADYRIEVGGISALLTASYKDVTRTDKPNVQWSFAEADATSIASLSGGLLTALAAGRVTVVASADGQSAEAEFACRKLISYFVLTNNENADKRGIAQETVVATYSYDEDGNKVPNTMTIGIALPTGVEVEEFEFSTDSDYVTVSGNVLTFAGGFDDVQTVVVTVKAKYPKYSTLTVDRTYAFNLKDAISASKLSDILRASEKHDAVCVTADIGLSGVYGCQIFNDFYGNGYLISPDYAVVSDPYQVTGGGLFDICASNVVFSNAVLRSTRVSSNTVSSLDLVGTVLFVNRSGNEATWITDVTVEYCVLENGRFCLHPRYCDLTVDGCIIRNSASYNLYMENDGPHHQNVVLNNCIFSNSLVVCIAVTGLSPSTSPDSVLSITGFCDLYNWQKLSNMDFVGGLLDNQFLADFIKTLLQERYMDEQYTPLRNEIDGEIYVHLGILSSGLVVPTACEMNMGDERFKHYQLTISDMPACDLYCYEAVEPTIQPGDFYTEDAALYAKLRGENI